MKRLALLSLSLLSMIACDRSGAGPRSPDVRPTASRHAMRAFGSEKDLDSFLSNARTKAEAKRKKQMEEMQSQPGYAGAYPSAVAEAAPAQAAPAPPADAKATDKDGVANESITNNQTAGVDEGGIVKTHGDHLVVLRRGRLFTVAVGKDRLQPISSANAYGPDIDPSGTWYDEMLVEKNTIVVIGYSYARGGTEVGLFDIDDAGNIAHRGTYHLRANDYYSSRNYASRLVGDKLVFYSPLYMNVEDKEKSWMPAVRKWKKGATDKDFVKTLSITHTYAPLDDDADTDGLALHTVTSCDLSTKSNMKCTSNAVMAPPGRVFYVSQKAVYVWTTNWTTTETSVHSPSQLYRMPLDGSDPTVVRTTGVPIDQFSFLEEENMLDVVVKKEGNGEAMWQSESKPTDMALMRISLDSFDQSGNEVVDKAYEPLPGVKSVGQMQNRFVGDRLLYGVGNTWGYVQENQDRSIYARKIDGGQTKRVALKHGVDRIEQMGKDAVVVGSDGKDLHFSAVALDGDARFAGAYVEKNATQGETRSHGFFYKPDGDRKGIFGLPITSMGTPGYAQLTQGSASVLFVKNDGLKFADLGGLASAKTQQVDDKCKASCVDWYGNARPIFWKGRIFALLGYELVEGSLDGSQIHEKRRVDFTPRQ